MARLESEGGQADLQAGLGDTLLHVRDGSADQGLQSAALNASNHIAQHHIEVNQSGQTRNGDGFHHLLQRSDELLAGGDNELLNGAVQDGGQDVQDGGLDHHHHVVVEEAHDVVQHGAVLRLDIGAGKVAEGEDGALEQHLQLVHHHVVHGVGSDAARQQRQQLGHVAGVHPVGHGVGIVDGSRPPVHLPATVLQGVVELGLGELIVGDLVLHVRVEALGGMQERLDDGLEDDLEDRLEQRRALVLQERVDLAADLVHDHALELVLLLDHRGDQLSHLFLDLGRDAPDCSSRGDPSAGAGGLDRGADGLADQVHGHGAGRAFHDAVDDIVDDLSVQHIEHQLAEALALVAGTVVPAPDPASPAGVAEGHVEGLGDAQVLVVRGSGLPAGSAEGSEPLLTLLVISALDEPGAAAPRPRHQLDARLAVLRDVIAIELVSSVSGAENAALELASLAGAVVVVDAEVVALVVDGEVAGLPVLHHLTALGEDARLQDVRRNRSSLQLEVVSEGAGGLELVLGAVDDSLGVGLTEAGKN